MFSGKAVSSFCVLILSSFLVPPSLAGAGEKSTTIIGGTTVSDSNPDGASTVAIVIELGQGEAICTGSLLAEDILVTAAHCVTGEDGNTVSPAQLTLIFGSDIRSPNRILVKATGVVRNSKYDPEGAGKNQNDIAVIGFGGGLPSGYQKATLLPSSTVIPNGAPAVLIGYGVNTMADGGSGEGILREVTVPVADGKFAKTEVLLDQREKKGACHGDSGGPAFARKDGKLLLWGVTNRGNPDDAPDDCAHFSVYTRITAQRAFINSASRSLRAPARLASR
jgi:secreted trypsin-like serine protease